MRKRGADRDFWDHLGKRVEKIPGGSRFVEKLKEKYLQEEYSGDGVRYLSDGVAYQKAIEMFVAEVEFLSSSERCRRADERRMLKEKEFWLTVLEETGLDENSNLAFDTFLMGVVYRSKKEQDAESHRVSLDGYRNLVAAALFDPLAASRMVNDPSLKFVEIKRLADAITEGDFKPKLRSIVQEWINDPIKARQCHTLLVREKMPQWLIQISEKLGQRKKYFLN